MSGSAIAGRSAIEALRAGVPNRAAIRLLGSGEAALQQDFLGRLGLCNAALLDGRQVEGIIFAGAFGAGKTHQLGYLAELALQEKFIVSQVPISKETPLFDAARLFAAAIRAAVVPGANDDVMTAVMSRLDPKQGSYESLEIWTTSEVQCDHLSPLFAALLHLIPRTATDPDRNARIARFFGGGKLSMTAVKGWLRDAGAAKVFDLRAVREADLAAQRIRFAPRLFVAAGFAGWCLLFDEVELIGRYSPLQRGRSYAELGRWLGLEAVEPTPGVVCVAAITDDFADEIFNRKRDGELIPSRLEASRWHQQSALARRGMEWLERHHSRLNPPTEAGLRQSLDKITGLYHSIYSWCPQPMRVDPVMATMSMRQYVKSWITSWDIERLYQQTPQIEAGTIRPDYTENPDIERATASEDEDGTE